MILTFLSEISPLILILPLILLIPLIPLILIFEHCVLGLLTLKGSSSTLPSCMTSWTLLISVAYQSIGYIALILVFLTTFTLTSMPGGYPLLMRKIQSTVLLDIEGVMVV